MERKKQVKWSFPEVPEDKPTAKLWDGEEYCTVMKKRNIVSFRCTHVYTIAWVKCWIIQCNKQKMNYR